MDPRQRIVQAAARVFAETGYRGATTRRIAHAANVNEVTLFRHFRSKEELLREAIAQAVREGEMAERTGTLLEGGSRSLRRGQGRDKTPSSRRRSTRGSAAERPLPAGQPLAVSIAFAAQAVDAPSSCCTLTSTWSSAM